MQYVNAKHRKRKAPLATSDRWIVFFNPNGVSFREILEFHETYANSLDANMMVRMLTYEFT